MRSVTVATMVLLSTFFAGCVGQTDSTAASEVIASQEEGAVDCTLCPLEGGGDSCLVGWVATSCPCSCFRDRAPDSLTYCGPGGCLCEDRTLDPRGPRSCFTSKRTPTF